MKYLNEAPDCLKKKHVGSDPGKKLLGLMLSEARMKMVWRRLSRRIQTDTEWMKLWAEIKNAIYYANKISPGKTAREGKTIAEEQQDYAEIAKKADELANLIRFEHRSESHTWHLDLDCDNFFPPGSGQILGVCPTMAELLNELAAQAKGQAKEVTSKRLVLKAKNRWPETVFIRLLHKHLSNYAWGKSDFLFANIADITNMAINSKLLKQDNEIKETISPKFARNAVQPIKAS